MRAKLFPATMTQPTTAFTFQVLKQFHLLHLEGKLSAYDFIGALRRLSDTAFPQRIAVCSVVALDYILIYSFNCRTLRRNLG